MAWADDVPLIQDGADGDAATLNTPLLALAGRTDYLKDRLDLLTDKATLVVNRARTYADVVAGDLVYYDASCNRYAKAQALWDSAYIANGELLAAPQAYVRGLVLSKPTADTADILLQGKYASTALADHVLGAGAAAGLYYLSATAAGLAAAAPPPLKVPTLTYQGNGEFVFHPPAIFQPNHLHRSHTLRKPWYPASDPRFDGMDKPAWAKMGYDIDSDPAFKGWFAAYPGALAVFIDGLLQEDAKVVTTTSNVWWMGTYAGSSSSSQSSGSSQSNSSSLSDASSLSTLSSDTSQSTQSPSSSSSSSSLTSPSSSSSSSPTSSSESSGSSLSSLSSSSTSSTSQSSGSSSTSSSSGESNWPNGAKSIVAFGYVPMIAGEPVVRAIGTDTPAEVAVARQESGVVKVSMYPWLEVAGTPDGTAVQSISGRTLRKVQIVTGITGSGGVHAVRLADGTVDLSTGDIIEGLLDAELVNLNNAVELTDDPYFYYVFPAGRVASIVGKRAIPRLDADHAYEVAAWAYRKGISSTPATFPEIVVEMTHVASPRYGSAPMPAAPQVTTAIAARANTVDTQLYYGETPAASRLTVTREGTVYLKFSMPTATVDRKLTRFGILVYLKT